MTRGVFFEKWGPNEEHHWEPFSRDLEQIVKAAQAEQRRKDAEIARTTPFRAHAKDDIDFHSGCEQTRDRIVAALKAQEDG